MERKSVPKGKWASLAFIAIVAVLAASIQPPQAKGARKAKPDLTITNVYLQQNAYGNKCRIWITAKNVGNGPISNGDFRRATVYLLKGSTVWGGYALTAVDPTGVLKTPGKSLSFPWNAILLPPGTYNIGAQIDPSNAINESNESNNKFNPITLTCRGSQASGGSQGLPDLVITSFGLKRWGECKPGQPVMTFQVTIKNIGTAPSPDIGKKALVQVKDQAGSGWGNGAIVGRLNPGESKTVEVPVYYLKSNPNYMVYNAPHPFVAVADPLHLVKESNEKNNTSGIIKTGAPRNCQGITPKPNLGLYGFPKIANKQVFWGSTVVLTPKDARLISNGRPAFNISYAFREYNGGKASGFKNTLTFNSKVVSIQSNLSVEPKQIQHVSTQAYLDPQNGKLCFNIDADNQITETSESNNQACVNVEFRGFSQGSSSSTGTGKTIQKPALSPQRLHSPPPKQPNRVLPGDAVKGTR